MLNIKYFSGPMCIAIQHVGNLGLMTQIFVRQLINLKALSEFVGKTML